MRMLGKAWHSRQHYETCGCGRPQCRSRRKAERKRERRIEKREQDPVIGGTCPNCGEIILTWPQYPWDCPLCGWECDT